MHRSDIECRSYACPVNKNQLQTKRVVGLSCFVVPEERKKRSEKANRKPEDYSEILWYSV